MTVKYIDVPLQRNISLDTKQKEIIEKHLEFTEAMHSKKTLRSNYDLARQVVEGLEFSESALQSFDHHFDSLGHQFDSADQTTPFVGNWTTGTLNMLIQEVGSSVEKDTVLSLEFPDKPVPQYKVILDRIAANSGILPEFDGSNSPLPTTRPLDTYGLEYQPGLWAARTPLGSKDIFFARERGQGTFMNRGIGQLVAYNAVNLTVQALTRKKQMLSDAVFNNGFTYAGMTINSNIPSGNYVALDPMGTLNTSTGVVTYTNTDPLYTPFIAMTNLLNNPNFLIYRPYVVGLVVNPADLQAIMNHPNVKPVTNIFMATGAAVGTKTIKVQVGELTKELMAYYAPGFEIPLIAEQGVWLGQNANGTANKSSQNFFVPRGKMKVLLDLSSIGGVSGAFHLTYNEVDPNQESPAMGLFTGVFNRNLQNSDNVNRLDIVASLAGAPAVYMPEAQWILTGLYSNV